jgi:hypothetical protein
MAKIGRNDPCPCGSGKKFKYCCLRATLMQQAARVPMDRVQELLDWLADFLGRAWVSRQLSVFKQLQRSSTRALTIRDFHPLVRGLAEGSTLGGTVSLSRPLEISRAAIRAATHAYDLRLVGHYMPSVVKSPNLRGRLLSTDGGAESLLFELAIGVHYLLQGCSVQFPELASCGNTDVLIQWNSHDIEIQCKRKSLGSGRKVPNSLFERLTLLISDAWSSANGAVVIIISCADRLASGDLQALASEINCRLRAGWQGKTELVDGAYSLAIESRGVAGSRVPAESLNSEFSPYFSDPTRPPHIALVDQLPIQLVVPTSVVSPAYFLCRSRQQDAVLDNVMESCREGARQLGCGRPGIVAVHVPEPITQDTLERMTAPTAIGDALRREFEDRGRSLSRAAAVVISGENFWPFYEGEWWGGFPGVLFRNESAASPLPDNYPLLGNPPATGEPTE